MCVARLIATRAGDMLWNPRHDGGRGGYLWPLPIPTYVYARTLPRYAWPFCPFCGATLPPGAAERREAPPPSAGDATAWDGEEAG
jgi:hypothetical protein